MFGLCYLFVQIKYMFNSLPNIWAISSMVATISTFLLWLQQVAVFLWFGLVAFVGSGSIRRVGYLLCMKIKGMTGTTFLGQLYGEIDNKN